MMDTGGALAALFSGGDDMADLSEKIGYIRGIFSGMELDAEGAQAKFYKGLLDALEEMQEEMGDLREDLNELNDFVESIDEDLEDLESMHDSEEGGLDFPDEEDEDFEDEPFSPEESLRVVKAQRTQREDGLVGSVCSECEKLFFVQLADIEVEGARFTCPHCHSEVPLNPIGPDNAPIAKRTDSE